MKSRFFLVGIASLTLIALAIALLVSVHPALAGSRPLPVNGISTRPAVTIVCGNTQVPYGVYSMPITHTETLTLTFTASGAGLITFYVNNYVDTTHWARTDASCGTCTLVVPNVPPGPLGVLQLSATAAADACPSSGLTVNGFALTVSP